MGTLPLCAHPGNLFEVIKCIPPLITVLIQESSKLLYVLFLYEPFAAQAFGDLGAAVGVTSVCRQEVHVQHWLSENSWE